MYKISDVIATLNQIDVRGRDNMDRLLGCIIALESIQAEQDAPVDEETEVTETDG